MRNALGAEAVDYAVGADWHGPADPAAIDAAVAAVQSASVPSPANKYRDRVCKNLEMTGIYHTILKCPEFDPDIYLTE